MTDIQAAIATLTALVVALTGLVPAVITIWRRLSAQDRRIDLFWRARLLRGTAEALQKRLASEQVGPESIDPESGGFVIAITPAAARHYEPIAERLAATHAKYKDESPTRLAELIEERFGPWIAANICVPLGVSEYACIVMALSIASGVKPVELPGTGDHTV